MSHVTGRSRSTLLCLAVLCTPAVAGCGHQDDHIPVQQVSSGRGAFRTVMPDGWSLTSTYRLSDPDGEGITAASADKRELDVYVSLTALQAMLGDDPSDTSLYNFQHIQVALSHMLSLPIGEGCSQDAVRPVEGGGFYGRVRLMRDCSSGQSAEVRVIAVDALRTTVAWVTVSDADTPRALAIARAVLSRLEVDRDSVPTQVPRSQVAD